MSCLSFLLTSVVEVIDEATEGLISAPSSGNSSSSLIFSDFCCLPKVGGLDPNLISFSPVAAPLGCAPRGPPRRGAEVFELVKVGLSLFSYFSRAYHPEAPFSYSYCCLRFWAWISFLSLMRPADSSPMIRSVFSSSEDS